MGTSNLAEKDPHLDEDLDRTKKESQIMLLLNRDHSRDLPNKIQPWFNPAGVLVKPKIPPNSHTALWEKSLHKCTKLLHLFLYLKKLFLIAQIPKSGVNTDLRKLNFVIPKFLKLQGCKAIFKIISKAYLGREPVTGTKVTVLLRNTVRVFSLPSVSYYLNSWCNSWHQEAVTSFNTVTREHS